MTLTVDENTYAAYQAARRDRVIVPRDIVLFTGRDRSSPHDIQHIGVWNGSYALAVPVKLPSDGSVVYRTVQPMRGRMIIPKIPRKLGLEVRSITLTFSNLSPAVVNAVRAWDPRKQPIQVYRALLDPISRKFVAPAICSWDGIVNRAPITKATIGTDGKTNNDGKVEVETVCHAQWLTIPSGDKMDADFFERRGDQSGKYISTIWRVPVNWGADTVVHGERHRPKQQWIR